MVDNAPVGNYCEVNGDGGDHAEEQAENYADRNSDPGAQRPRRLHPRRLQRRTPRNTTGGMGALKRSVIGTVSCRNLDNDRHSSGGSTLSTSGTNGGSRGSSLDLEAITCTLNVIEGIRGAGSLLTSAQEAAIGNLRSMLLNPPLPPVSSPPARSNSRREAMFFKTGYETTLLENELLKCFHEVEDNAEDTDQMEAATAVLATYGGQVFQRRKHIHDISRDTDLSSSRDVLHSRHSSFNSDTGSINLEDIGLDLSERENENHHSIRRASNRRTAAANLDPLECTESMKKFFASDSQLTLTSKNYCPPEWNALKKEARTELTRLLSWENISKWEFNVLDVANYSREVLSSRSGSLHGMEGQFCPLLLVGWAILCSPMAQQAMEGSLGDDYEKEETSSASCPYFFITDLNLNPEAICNFLREIESKYRPELPYHNNVHAADVTQTLHCLLQFMGPDILEILFDPVEIFSILLAATFHDVDHRGTNNLFQQNAMTSLAIQYNDASILESMHSAIGHSFLMGEEKRKEWDVFEKWSDGQKKQARSVMIRSVLGTDMSKHFESVGELASLVDKIRAQDMEEATRGEPRPILSILTEVLAPKIMNTEAPDIEAPLEKECNKFTDFILKFLLHAADISNPTKRNDLAVHWADKALAEFFAQGDREKELGLPVSPLCDRDAVHRADSQIGFLKFVIRPTFVLLGEILPRVKEEVLPRIDENLNYWTREKKKLLMGLMNASAKLKQRLSSVQRRSQRHSSLMRIPSCGDSSTEDSD